MKYFNEYCTTHGYGPHADTPHGLTCAQCILTASKNHKVRRGFAPLVNEVKKDFWDYSVDRPRRK